MRKECKMVYTYDELGDSAKEKAREWWSQGVFNDSCDWEHVYEDAERMGALMGIDIDHRSYKTVGGKTGHEPAIYFSGFSSQGDGACFEGSYRYKKGAIKALKAECNDDELLRIAYGLREVQRKHFYHLYAVCKHRGYYSHSGCMSVDVEHSEDQYRDIGDAEQEIKDLLRCFADWIYEQLEAEHDYQTSDEAVEEMLTNNPYEFYENGERV